MSTPASSSEKHNDPFHTDKMINRMIARAVDATTDSLFIMEHETARFVYVNDTAVKTLGYGKEELLGGMNVFDIDPDLTFAQWEALGPTLKPDEPLLTQSRHRTKDGRVFPIEITAHLFVHEGREYRMAATRDITERKRMESELAQRETAFRSLADNSPDNVARWDTKGRYLYVNPTHEVTLGAALPEIQGRCISDIVPDHEEVIDAVFRVAKSGENETVRQTVTGKDGTEYHDVTITPEKDASGKIISVLGVGRDVTATVLLQDELAGREEMFRTLVENIPDHIVRYDTACRAVYVGPTLERVLGPEAATRYLGQTPVEMDPQDLQQSAHYQRGIEQTLATGEIHEIDLEWLLPSGQPQYHTVRFVPEFDNSGTVSSVLAVGNDITAYKNAEAGLRKTKTKLASVISTIPDLVWVKDEAGVYLLCNPAFERFFGAPAEAIIGKTDYDFISKEQADFFRQKDKEATAAGKMCINEERIIFKENGQEALLETRKIPVYDGETFMGVLGIGRDVTEHKEMEAVLQESNTRYREIMDNSTDVIYLVEVTEEGRFIHRDINTAFGDSVGVPKEAIIDRYVDEIEDEGFREILLEKYGSCLHAGAKTQYTNTYRLKGEDRIYQSTLSPIRDQNGRISRIVGVARDISERTRMEELLKNRELSLNEAQRIAHVGSWELEHGTNLLSWSDEIFRIFEIDKERFGASYEAFLEAIHPDDREKVAQAFEVSVKNKTPYAVEHRLLMQDGRIKYVLERGETRYAGDGSPLHTLGTVHDITDRKEQEERLHQKEEEFRTLAENIPDTIARFDTECRRTYVNPAFERIFGCRAADAVGKTPTELSPLPDNVRFEELLWHVMKTGKAISLDMPFINDAGEEGFGNGLIVPEFGPDGSITGILAIGRDLTERKRAEEALALKELEFRTLAENTPDVVVRYDRELRRVYANPAWEKANGIPAEEVIGLTPSQKAVRVAPFAADYEAHLRRALDGQSGRYQIHWVDESGMPVFFDQEAVPEYDGNGKVSGILTVARDVTERMLSESRLKEALDFSNAIIHAIPDLLFELDAEGNYLDFWSRDEAERLHYKEYLTGKNIRDLLAPLSLETATRAMDRTDREGVSLGNVYSLETDEGTRWFELSMTKRESTQSYIALSREISVYKETEQRLKAALEFTDGIIRTVPDTLIETSEDGYCLNIWSREETVLPGRAVALLGKNIRQFLPPDAAGVYFKSMEEAKQNGISRGSIYRAELPDGERWFELSVSRKESDDTYISIVRDITDLKRKEAELSKAVAAAAAANSAKSEFLANMSHEIRTPLNAIVGMAHLLDHEKLEARQKHYASRIVEASDTLLELIGGILDFSKIESGKLEIDYDRTDLYALILEIRDLFEARVHEKQLEFVLNIADDVPPSVIGDRVRIRQILVNLIGNAVKFTEAGSVTLSASVAASDGSSAVVELGVRDTGIGIAEEHQQKLFALFSQADSSTTRKYGGSGLGLAISKKLAELMGGEIGVTSAPGEGSYFFARIPFTMSPDLSRAGQTGFDAMQRSKPRTHDTGLLEGKILLVVDDNEVNREALTGILQRYGAKTDEAVDGRDAVEMILRDASRYDAVLMDIQMPVMDGYEATRAIRRHGLGELPVIVLSADVTQQSIRRAKASGADDYLLKPVRTEALLKTLGDHLGLEPEENRAPADAPTGVNVPLPDIYESIDMEQATQIADNDTDVLCKMLSKLHALLKKSYATLIEQADAEDLEGVKRTAHTIKGSAGNLGIVHVAESAAAMERALQSGRFGAVQESIIAMGRALIAFETDLASLCPCQEAHPTREGILPDLEPLLEKIRAFDAEAKEMIEEIMASAPADGAARERLTEAAEALENYDFKLAETAIESLKETK